jgi:seryl-tRNA synthetase
MLDIKRIRDNADAVNRALQRRNPELSVDDILAIDGERRKLLTEEESLRSRRNQLTKEIAQVKKADGDAEALLAESKQLADRIKDIEAEKEVLAERQQALLLTLPNTPQDCVPSGASDADNPVVRTWGEQLKGRPPVEPLAHYEIPILRLSWRGQPTGARPDQLYAGPAHRARLHGSVAAVYGEPGGDDRHRPAA